jgi:hypothetical protein
MASRAGPHSSKEPAKLITAATTMPAAVHASVKPPRRSRWVIADRLHPLEPLADIIITECELSGAL